MAGFCCSFQRNGGCRHQRLTQLRLQGGLGSLGSGDLPFQARQRPAALLGRLLDVWAGDGGRVRRVACSYRGMDMIDKDVVCRGVITGKRQENGSNVVDLEVWTEDPDGKKTTPGTAVVELPSK